MGRNVFLSCCFRARVAHRSLGSIGVFDEGVVSLMFISLQNGEVWFLPVIVNEQ